MSTGSRPAIPLETTTAFHRILDQLAPDEARILLVLHLDGPQPTVDVQLGGMSGRLAPRVLARGLSLVGSRAAVRRPEWVSLYLTNLRRLGLVVDVEEPVADLLRYQVVEAQPAVLHAVRAAGRAVVVRRSLRLTPLGRRFIDACLVDGGEQVSVTA